MHRDDSISLNRIINILSWQNFSSDLKIICLLLGLGTLGIYVPILNESTFRIIFAVPLVLFTPGYSLTAALFPKNSSIDGIERIALSIGLSIIVLPLIGLALNSTSWGIHLTPIIVSLIIFTLIMVLIAQYRRHQELEKERFQVFFGEIFREIFKGIKKDFPSLQDPPITRFINIIVLIALMIAVCTIVYAIVIPKVGEKYTEFYILGENGKAASYPTNLIVGSPAQIIIGIGNHEYQKTTYVVEVWLINMTINSTTNATFIDHMERLDQFPLSLEHNQTYQEYHKFTPPSMGFNHLAFLLFEDTSPSTTLTWNERVNSSYRNLNLRVTIKSPFDLNP